MCVHVYCVCVCTCFFYRQKTSFVVSGSTDRTLKFWSLRSLKHKLDEVCALCMCVCVCVCVC